MAKRRWTFSQDTGTLYVCILVLITGSTGSYLACAPPAALASCTYCRAARRVQDCDRPPVLVRRRPGLTCWQQCQSDRSTFEDRTFTAAGPQVLVWNSLPPNFKLVRQSGISWQTVAESDYWRKQFQTISEDVSVSNVLMHSAHYRFHDNALYKSTFYLLIYLLTYLLTYLHTQDVWAGQFRCMVTEDILFGQWGRDWTVNRNILTYLHPKPLRQLYRLLLLWVQLCVWFEIRVFLFP